MTRRISIEPLAARSFAQFGDVIEIQNEPTVVINRGMCDRYSDLASIEFTDNGRAGISLFHGRPYTLPLTLDYVERHPLGSQAFLPMSADPFFIVVAGDDDGVPLKPKAFISTPGQGVNYHRGIWHGVLTPLEKPALFTVVDRIGGGENLEEYWFDEPYVVVESAQ